MYGRGLVRLPRETWRNAVQRIARGAAKKDRNFKLIDVCLTAFDREVKSGTEDAQAAWLVLDEHNLLFTINVFDLEGEGFSQLRQVAPLKPKPKPKPRKPKGK